MLGTQVGSGEKNKEKREKKRRIKMKEKKKDKMVSWGREKKGRRKLLNK